jgi:cystathionine gamma-synthase
MPPLYLSANYSFQGLGQQRAYDYSRTANPSRDLLASALAELEGGAGAVVTSSGMSAVLLATSLLSAGDRVVVPHNCYGGCHRAFSALSRRGHFAAHFADFTRSGELEASCAQLRPRMIWVETPSNPLLRVTDIRAAAAVARRHDALLVVDNTFLSPALQQPLRLGADLVVHSTTKFINGHSDVIGGAVVASDAALADELAWWANCLGLTASPFDCYLTQRGLRTLHARLRAHEENTQAVVELLAAHEAINRVFYPGLPQHPDHELASRQQRGFGSIVSFELSGGEAALHAFIDGLDCFTLAESLGGVESLVCHPASMTHAAMEPADQRAAGIAPGLLRLSVGIEHPGDLLADLSSALDAALQGVLPRLGACAGG